MGKKKKREVIQLTIDKYVAEGKCLAYYEGKVVFVSHVVPGDIVEAVLVKNKKDFAEAIVLNTITASAQRIPHFCKHFGTCGGCQWQQLPYEKQAEYKQQQVYDQLHRISKQPLPELLPIVTADEQQYYRNKVEYTYSNKRYLSKEELADKTLDAFENVGGYHVRGFFDKIIDIDECHLQAAPSNEIRKFIKQYAIDNQLPFYDLRMHEGWLRNLQIRISTLGEIMVNIILKFNHEIHTKGLCEALYTQFPNITALLYTINPKLNDSMQGLTPVVYKGRNYIIEQLEQFTFKISPKSFFQTNTKQAEKLYTVTRAFAEIQQHDIVYDLYCGTGSIGIFCSRLAGKIIGVEMVEDAIMDAKENAALNNISNTHFFVGAAEKICDTSFFEKYGRPNVIITDPPRAGMHQALIDVLLQIEAPRIVYVSCNPATQARDLALLGAKYTITKSQAVDMFPHTHHIENVVQLTLKG
jgi:23S rRNA (uracil1939-C5)-methyltransferase